MIEEPHHARSEEQRLARRIRTYVVVALLSISLQGMVLAYALDGHGSVGMWVLWAAVFVFSATATTCAMVRASKLSKRYRRLKWGEK